MPVDPPESGHPRESAAADAGAEAWIAHAVAGALAGAGWIALAGLGFAIVAVGLVATAGLSHWLAAVALVLALAQLWVLLRVAIDRRLFDALAANRDLASLDAALLELGWMAAHRAGRPLRERARGALRLVRIGGALAVAQLALTFVISTLR